MAKMPDQSCVNGLVLSTIPPELKKTNRLQYHLTGLQTPFMKIFVVRKYGRPFRVNGLCVNVETLLII